MCFFFFFLPAVYLLACSIAAVCAVGLAAHCSHGAFQSSITTQKVHKPWLLFLDLETLPLSRLKEESIAPIDVQ